MKTILNYYIYFEQFRQIITYSEEEGRKRKVDFRCWCRNGGRKRCRRNELMFSQNEKTKNDIRTNWAKFQRIYSICYTSLDVSPCTMVCLNLVLFYRNDDRFKINQADKIYILYIIRLLKSPYLSSIFVSLFVERAPFYLCSNILQTYALRTTPSIQR